MAKIKKLMRAKADENKPEEIQEVVHNAENFETTDLVLSSVDEDLEEHEESGVAKIEVMEKILRLVSDEFNLGSEYVMTAFKDAWSKAIITMDNRDFEVTVRIKNTERVGIRTLTI